MRKKCIIIHYEKRGDNQSIVSQIERQATVVPSFFLNYKQASQ